MDFMGPKENLASKCAKLSVVIPCFNHGEFLPEAVASVTDIRRDDVELIVVDDGSTDGRTHKEVDALIAAGITVIRQENKGLAAARNAGILASAAKYILPLDADNRLRPGYVEHGIRILDSNPQIGVVYGDAEYIGTGNGRWHVGPFDRHQLLRANYIDACAAYRRLIWEQNRGYDCTMPVQGAEDWDFWLSTLENGWQFAYVPEILFDYRVAEQSMLTRLRPFEQDLEDFLATKHGLLYRRVWLQTLNESQSVRVSFRHLLNLLITRLMRKRDK
jgi:glycosyltransferase involved in cell wall biosynthesis